MPSSSITIFSDVAKNVDGGKLFSKYASFGVLSQKAVATIPAATATSTDIGMIPFQEGFNLVGLSIKSDDLDTSTNVTLDVGYIYDSSTLSGDTDAFFNDIDIAQDAGSVVYPVADGLSVGTGFVAEGSGFIFIRIGGGATTTAGDITVQAIFTYDN